MSRTCNSSEHVQRTSPDLHIRGGGADKKAQVKEEPEEPLPLQDILSSPSIVMTSFNLVRRIRRFSLQVPRSHRERRGSSSAQLRSFLKKSRSLQVLFSSSRSNVKIRNNLDDGQTTRHSGNCDQWSSTGCCGARLVCGCFGDMCSPPEDAILEVKELGRCGRMGGRKTLDCYCDRLVRPRRFTDGNLLLPPRVTSDPASHAASETSTGYLRRALSLLSLLCERSRSHGPPSRSRGRGHAAKATAQDKAARASQGPREKRERASQQRILRPPARPVYRRGVSGLPIRCTGAYLGITF